MSPELHLMRRPAAAYRQLAEDWPDIHPVAALRRPAIAALAAAAAVSIAATGRATAPLVFSTALCWSFAFVWQLLAAGAAVTAPGSPLTRAQRIDLFFAGHAPWSLWFLGAAAWSRLMPDHTDLYTVLLTGAVPAAWTLALVHGFFTGALNLPHRRALTRTLWHQALIWSFAFVYVAWAVALWPRASLLLR